MAGKKRRGMSIKGVSEHEGKRKRRKGGKKRRSKKSYK